MDYGTIVYINWSLIHTKKEPPRGGGTTKLEIKQIKENKNIIWLND